MSFLSSLLDGTRQTQSQLILLQSSAARSALPILRAIINTQRKSALTVLVCALYQPAELLGSSSVNPNSTTVLDWTAEVPGYSDEPIDWPARLSAIKDAVKASTKPVKLVFDSVDTLEDDFASPSKAYKFLADAHAAVRAGQDPSRLVLHLTPTCTLRPSLVQPAFAVGPGPGSGPAPTFIHLTAHPPALLTHIASAYLTTPPPSGSGSSEPEHAKFWSVYVPLAARERDVERLVFGSEGEGSGAGGGARARGKEGAGEREMVVDVLVRARGGDAHALPLTPSALSAHRRRGVERTLEGWSGARSVPLSQLASLRSIWRRPVAAPQDAPDPTKNLSFNLNLTESQQASRAQVPLPYEHDGNPPVPNQGPQIFYDPDSADDLDEEDPDEDLDI